MRNNRAKEEMMKTKKRNAWIYKLNENKNANLSTPCLLVYLHGVKARGEIINLENFPFFHFIESKTNIDLVFIYRTEKKIINI